MSNGNWKPGERRQKKGEVLTFGVGGGLRRVGDEEGKNAEAEGQGQAAGGAQIGGANCGPGEDAKAPTEPSPQEDKKKRDAGVLFLWAGASGKIQRSPGQKGNTKRSEERRVGKECRS